MSAPKMPQIRQAIEQARALDGLEDTEDFGLQAPALLVRLVQYLDLYVGHEPTLAEEEAHVRQQHIAERDAEILYWLGKKALEYRSTGSRQHALQADVIDLMASKISRGAVRPDNTRLPADVAPIFFQPGHTYQRRRWLFQCLAVAPSPFNGEARAVGFLYRPGEPATVTGLDPDDWADGGWAEGEAARD